MKKLSLIFFYLGNICLSAQNFELPPIPSYDSVANRAVRGQTIAKKYFQDGVLVLHKGYSSGVRIHPAFEEGGWSDQDSCYTYFDQEAYHVYSFEGNTVAYDTWSETSLYWHYHKFTLANETLEKGTYYIQKDMRNQYAFFNSKYRVGKWIRQQDDYNPFQTLDFDQLIFDDQNLEALFVGEKATILKLKTLAEEKLIEVYGKKFFKTYIRFNVEGSSFMTDTDPHQPYGSPLFRKIFDRNIKFVDFTYDIILGDHRFSVIKFRINRQGEFLGKTYFPRQSSDPYYLTQGLDLLTTRKLDDSVINWQQTAADEGMDIGSKAFNVRFEWVYREGLDGQLRFILEEAVGSTLTHIAFLREVKQVIINPWTGEKTYESYRTQTGKKVIGN